MHSTVSALVVFKPCHIRMSLICSVNQETKQRYDFERQIVNSATLVGNAEYLKTKRCRKICLLSLKSLWPLRSSRIFVSTPSFLSSLKSLMSETSSAGFILNDHVTQIHSSYLTNPTETKTFSERKKNGCSQSETNIQTSKMEVLVGHCLRGHR